MPLLPQMLMVFQKQIDQLQHWLQILSDMERRLGLGLDLLNGDTVRNLSQRQTRGEVNIEDTLGNELATVYDTPCD